MRCMKIIRHKTEVLMKRGRRKRYKLVIQKELEREKVIRRV